MGLGKQTVTSKDIIKNPKIVYPQYGEDTCVFSSLSSALFYLNYTDVALQIDEFKEKIMEEMFAESFENMMGKITNYIHEESYPYFRKVCSISKITPCNDFNLIEEATKNPMFCIMLFLSVKMELKIMLFVLFINGYLMATTQMPGCFHKKI